jgi:hypothetical protein
LYISTFMCSPQEEHGCGNSSPSCNKIMYYAMTYLNVQHNTVKFHQTEYFTATNTCPQHKHKQTEFVFTNWAWINIRILASSHARSKVSVSHPSICTNFVNIIWYYLFL